jgi:4-amino-4-deoxy-L-arabinose transferase-like glycosyltransferase
VKPRTCSVLALVLAIATTIAAAWISYAIFEHMPHVEDEFANLWAAHVMAEGEIYLSSPPLTRAFFIPFVVDYEGRRFAKYPPGWPATLSLGVRAGLTYLVNPVLAGLAVWLIYRLGRKISRPEIGLLAALLAAASPIHLMLSGTIMPHPWSLFLSLAFMLAWLDLFPASTVSKIGQSKIPTWMLILTAGLSLGLLALTRPLTAVGVALPFAVHGLIILFKGNRRQRMHAVAVAGLGLAVALLYPLWQAALTGDPLLNPYTLWWSYDKVGFGPGHGRTEAGHNLRSAMLTTFFTFRAGVHDFFGWPFLSWLFLPFGIVALWRNRDGWLALSVFPSLVLIHFTYWVGSWLFGPRYYYESLPGLSITTALGFAWIGGWLSKKSRWRSIRRKASLALLFILLLINITMYLPQRIAGMHGLYGVQRSDLEPVQEADFGKVLLIVHTHETWYEYGRLITLGPPYSEGDLILALSRGSARDRELIESYPDYDVVHYYPERPTEFYDEPR